MTKEVRIGKGGEEEFSNQVVVTIQPYRKIGLKNMQSL